MTNDAAPTSMQDPHTTDADLRLVAEAVGFHPTIAHPTPAALATKDDCAARWLLPWLQRKVTGGRGVAWLNLRCNSEDGGWMAYYERDFLGEIDENAAGDGDSLAEALFDLCHAIIKETQQ